jgi:EmrB/QacA subfamily drug resistance transporter
MNNDLGTQLLRFSTDSRARAALALIVTAQFMVVLDVAIVNVALPSIKTSLGFSQPGLQWVVSAYAIVFGGTLLLGGRLADLLGRRRLFVAGLLLFAATSLLCGLAWSPASLVVFRGVQGLAAAFLAPAALSLLVTSFAEGVARNRALGIYGAASGSGAAVGVLLGGLITSYLGWRWIFFINIPIGVAAALAAPFVLGESRGRLGHRHFDIVGATTITGGLMLFVYALTRAPEAGWAATSTLAALLAAAALIAAFVVVELRSPWPLLPLRIFRSRVLTSANAVIAMLSAVAFVEFYVLTLYLQDVLAYSAVETGLAFSALASSVVIASNLVQFVVARIGIQRTLTLGIVLSGLSIAYLSRLPVDARYFWDLFPGFVVGGIGLGISFVPVTIAGLQGVAGSDAGVASGLINTSRQIGGAIGIAAASAIVATSSNGAVATAGYQDALYAIFGVLVVAAGVAAVLVRPPRPRPVEAEIAEITETVELREAA